MAYKRYIDAVGLAEVIENLDIRVAGKPARWNDAKYSVLREISQAPDAGVEEVKHGEWVEIKTGEKLYDYCFKCSNCNKETPPNSFVVSPDYCPHCGAKMDGRK